MRTSLNENFRAVRYLLVQFPEKHIDKLLDAHQALEIELASLRAHEAKLVEALLDAADAMSYLATRHSPVEAIIPSGENCVELETRFRALAVLELT